VATICIKNFPADLHNAIRKKARKNRTSIRAEVIRALEETLYLLQGPTAVASPSAETKVQAKKPRKHD
jgi:plasmid stability protein